MSDEPFSDEDYRRLQAGGTLQRDIVLQMWRQNNPRHTPAAPEPSILDLISHRNPPESRSGFAETAVGPDRLIRAQKPPVEATEAPERPAARVCDCGCSRPLNRPNQRFASTRCRQRHWVAQKRRKQSTQKGSHA